LKFHTLKITGFLLFVNGKGDGGYLENFREFLLTIGAIVMKLPETVCGVRISALDIVVRVHVLEFGVAFGANSGFADPKHLDEVDV
jgi:hypothetical protein